MARLAFAALAGLLALGGVAIAEEAAPEPPHQTWSFDGVFGTFDRAALQRGFQVYKEVCATCHAVKHLAFRDLAEIGYSEDEVKGIAAQTQVQDGPNDTGEMFQRPARPSDPIPGPFAGSGLLPKIPANGSEVMLDGRPKLHAVNIAPRPSTGRFSEKQTR